jgi:hypothetical protein
LTNDERWFPPIYFKDDKIVKEIEGEFSRLEAAKDKRNKDLLKNMASDDSKSDKWLERLIASVESKDTVSRVEKRSVLGYLGIEQLLVNIEKCTISELNDFYYRFLQKNYGFNNIGDYYSNDVSNVEELISGLDKIIGKLKQAEGKRIFCFVLSQIKKYLEEDILVRLKR